MEDIDLRHEVCRLFSISLKSPLIEGDRRVFVDGMAALKDMKEGKKPGNGTFTEDTSLLRLDPEGDGFGYFQPELNIGAKLMQDFKFDLTKNITEPNFFSSLLGARDFNSGLFTLMYLFGVTLI